MNNRPKRRKDKDNPYTLKITEGAYLVTFKDNMLQYQEVKVDKNVFSQMDDFELEDISQLNKYSRHIEHSEIYDQTLYKRAVDKPISVEEQAENNIAEEMLRKAINMLSDVQKRRVKMYYFEDKTLEEIADLENCSKVAVKYSIDAGISNLRKKLTNFNN